MKHILGKLEIKMTPKQAEQAREFIDKLYSDNSEVAVCALVQPLCLKGTIECIAISRPFYDAISGVIASAKAADALEGNQKGNS